MPVPTLVLPPAKPWYLSKTILGLALALASYLAPAIGITLPPELADAIARALGVTVTPDQTQAAGLLGGLALAAYGRLVAKGPLGLKGGGGAKMAAVLGLGFTLSACGAVPWNAQNYSGITDAEVRVCREGEGTPFICHARIRDGKEKQNVALEIAHPDGWKVAYSASGVVSFRGQEIRSAVEQAVSADVKEAAPGVVDSVVAAVLKVLVP